MASGTDAPDEMMSQTNAVSTAAPNPRDVRRMTTTRPACTQVESTVSRVALLVMSLAVGGAETQVVALAKRLRARGIRVLIITLRSVNFFDEELAQAGVEVQTLDLRYRIPDPRALLRLAQILRQWQPEVLHCHMTKPNLLGRFTRKFIDVPVVISTIHNNYEGGLWRKNAYRITDRLSDFTACVSHAGATRYVHLGAMPHDRVHVMPNGVETERFRPDCELRQRTRDALGLADEQFVWLAVGRFEPPKDYPTMLRSYALLRQQQPHTHLLIAGTGFLEQQIRDLASTLAIDNDISFLGLRRDVHSLMCAADGFVLSSSSEGLPMVLLEAAATGLPIVATKVGGICEVVADGHTGYTTDAQSPQQLSAAMLRLQSVPPAERARMSSQARRSAEQNFGLESTTSAWIRVYRDLYSAHRPGVGVRRRVHDARDTR